VTHTGGGYNKLPLFFKSQILTFSQMSVSFDITDTMLFREFDDNESSAIHCVSVLHNNVTIAWKSNPEKQYIFRASDTYAPLIREIIRNWNPTKYSIGKEIAEARKSKQLEIIEI
jgi:hypothetical protein